jgi:hypothetical protein
MKVLREVFLFATVAIVSALLSGCFSPLLFLAGLGFTGYQYHEKEGVFAPGQPLGGPAPAGQADAKKGPVTQPTPSDDDIE